jgi:hypothetical protein
LLTLHGEIFTDVIQTRDEAESRNWFVGDTNKEFGPFLDLGRVELCIDKDSINLLGEMRASIDTGFDQVGRRPNPERPCSPPKYCNVGSPWL